MWKFEKITLLILMTLMTILGGLSTYWIDWTVFETKEGILKEVRLPLIFLALSINFMISYVKILKEEKK